MELSFVGLFVCAAILLVGYAAQGPIIVSLLASLAFGSTAIVTLSSLGGSSPLIYTFFAALLLIAVAVRKGIWKELGHVYGSVRPVWVLTALMLYAVGSAWLFPRLFAGQVAVFAQSETQRGIVVETSLEPVSANISQTGYFVLGGLTAIAFCVLLLHQDRLAQVRRGFFLWCSLHAGMGLIDLGGKLAGMTDVLRPIRTASYAMLTSVSEAGFWRIAGGYSEASSFGGASLACLAFTYAYWRKTASALALWLSGLLVLLLLLSTSSTAYVGLAILSIPVALSIGRSFTVRHFLGRDEVLILAVFVVGIFAAMSIALYNERLLDPVVHLIDRTILSKGSTQSGQERIYWNVKSLQSLVDTGGLGVGFGSSRASSWPVAVLSQLGLIGAVLTAMMLAVLFRGLAGLTRWIDAETNAIVAGVRASAIAGVVAASVSGGSADPGIFFFIAFAVIAVGRLQASRNRAAASALGEVVNARLNPSLSTT